MKFLLLSFLLFITMLIHTAPAATQSLSCDEDSTSLNPAPNEEEWAVEWWLPRHELKLVEEGRESAKILFLGDSIMHGWEDAGEQIWDETFSKYGAFNLGFSGDRTENVLWRIENNALDGLNPKLTILMIGTNNTGHRQDDPQCTAEGIKAIIDELQDRLPDSEILLLGILPRGETKDDENRVINLEVNKLIKHFDDKNGVTYRNIGHIFVDDNQDLNLDLMPDTLHPNEPGYKVWASEIEPVIKEYFEERK